MFCEIFFSKIIEVMLLFFDLKLADLFQKIEKLLSIYYKKVINFIHRFDVKDKIANNVFIILKTIILNIFLKNIFKRNKRFNYTNEDKSNLKTLKQIYENDI